MTNIPTKNNNPGDLKNTSTGVFNSYDNPQEGFNALKNDLQIKLSGKSKTGITPDSTLSDFSSKWAPNSDGNDSVAYAKNLASKLGVTTDTPIKNLSSRLDDFANAIADNEGYKGQRVAGTSQSANPAQPISDNNSSMKSDNSLAEKIKAKYPQYQDIPDDQLTQKILAKYPQYSDMAGGSAQNPPQRKTFTESIKNIQGSEPNADLKAGNPTTLGNTAVGNAIADITPGTTLAQGLGYALSNATGTQKGLIDANNQGIDIEGQLLKQIKANKAKGKDTSRLEKALQELVPNIQKTGNEVGDVGTGGITNSGVLKSAAGLAALPLMAYGDSVLIGTDELASGVLATSADIKNLGLIKSLAKPAMKSALENIGIDAKTFTTLKAGQQVDALTSSLGNLGVAEKAVVQQQIDKLLPTAIKEAGGKIPFTQLYPRVAKLLKVSGGLIKLGIANTVVGDALHKGEQIAGLIK